MVSRVLEQVENHELGYHDNARAGSMMSSRAKNCYNVARNNSQR